MILIFRKGLCCGLTSFAAGIVIGIIGESGFRALGQQENISWFDVYTYFC